MELGIELRLGGCERQGEEAGIGLNERRGLVFGSFGKRNEGRIRNLSQRRRVTHWGRDTHWERAKLEFEESVW